MEMFFHVFKGKKEGFRKVRKVAFEGEKWA